MRRILAVLSSGLVALGSAMAGPINANGTVNLTTTNVTAATCASNSGCTSALGALGGFGTATGNSSGGYMNQTFAAIDAANTSPNNNNPSAYFNTSNTSTTTPNAPDVPFDFQTNGAGKQIYSGASTLTDYQIVMNLGTGTAGVFGVSDIDTMIQANAISAAGTIVISVTGVDASNNAITDQITLNSGVDYRGANSLQAVTTTADGSGTATGGGSNGSTDNYNTGNVGIGSVTNTVTVFNDAFGTETKASNNANYYTDVQEIGLGGAFANGYIDSVTITSLAAASGSQELIFSGISLESSPYTPEPGTTTLFGVGIVAIVFLTVRRSRARA